MDVMRHGNPDKIISDYIRLSLNINRSHTKLLDYAIPSLYVLRGTLYSLMRKILMARKHLYSVSQEDVWELFESFQNV